MDIDKIRDTLNGLLAVVHGPNSLAAIQSAIAEIDGDDMPDPLDARVLSLTAHIVAAQCGAGSVLNDAIPALIGSVSAALRRTVVVVENHPAPTPAVPISESVTPDAITCLECGKSHKSLKRHLMAQHTLTPEKYRRRWGLPDGYPIVAPNYSAERTKLAKKMGLGKR